MIQKKSVLNYTALGWRLNIHTLFPLKHIVWLLFFPLCCFSKISLKLNKNKVKQKLFQCLLNNTVHLEFSALLHAVTPLVIPVLMRFSWRKTHQRSNQDISKNRNATGTRLYSNFFWKMTLELEQTHQKDSQNTNRRNIKNMKTPSSSTLTLITVSIKIQPYLSFFNFVLLMLLVNVHCNIELYGLY